MDRRGFVVLVSGVLAGCASEDSENPVEITDHERREQAGMYYVAGTAENTGEQSVAFHVLVTWYGPDDTVLDESHSQLGADIGPGERRAFDTTLYNPDDHGEPDRYAIEVVLD